MATMQEYFDKAYRALIRQGCGSFNGTRCMYNGPDGTHCAIGWLVDDPVKLRPLEGADALLICFKGLLDPPSDDNTGTFLTELQHAHDQCSVWATHEPFLTVFERNMRSLAAQFSLTVPEDV